MMFESSSKNRKSWDRRQMIRQCIPDTRSNRWKWFGGCHRINFKIATITFKVLQFQQPSYLAALIPRYVPTRSLRSSSLSLCIPTRKTEMAKSKSFSSVASSVWNKLPGHLSSISTLPAFRKKLKHHLFRSAFPGNPSTIHWHHVLWCQPIHRCDSGRTHPIAWLTRSSWAPTISRHPLRKVDYILAHV